jgi:hypothetical protein
MYITDALDELESWLWHHYPDTFLRSYQPGLTDEEIDVAFNKISLVPSLEIREMYKWYNGTNNLFDSPCFQLDWGIPFMSIEGAVENTIEYDWLAKQININSFCPFPEMECAMHFFACGDEHISPVLAIDEDFSTRITWTSITSMITTHLEAYQQGILSLERYHGDDKTRLAVRRSMNFDREFQVICDRHNSELEIVNISEKYKLK